ncbi:hypothetical protein ACEPAG_8909 [Sanghuangporus baumii]
MDPPSSAFKGRPTVVYKSKLWKSVVLQRTIIISHPMMQAIRTNSTIHESLVGVTATDHIKFDDSLGAVLIGLIFASILFGIANVQSLIYYQNSTNDPKYMKWTVMFLWLLDAFHLALISHATYRYLVTDFGSFIAITRADWSLSLQIIITVLSDFTISLFYVYRVWIMSNRSRLLSSAAWLIYINISFCVASDLWCALCLCYYLAKDRTGFRTSKTLKTLTLYIISTGLLTSICSICCLVLITTMPHSYSYIAVYFCLSKLYFNGFLGMLNARNYLREGISQVGSSHQGAYRLPQIVNIVKPSSSNHEGSFSTVQVISDKIANSVYRV